MGSMAWLLMLTAWWAGLRVGFDRAIAKTMGPVEKKLFIPYMWTAVGLLVLTFVAAVLRLFNGDPTLAIGLAALVIWRWRSIARPPAELQ